MSGDYQGSNKPVDSLVASHMRLAYAMAKNRSPLYLRDDAAQEAAFRMWEVAQKYDPKKGSFSTYVCTCMGRKIMDITKTEKRRSRHFEPFDSLDHDAAHGRTPLDDIINREDRSAINRLCREVKSLPLHERYVITSHYGLYDQKPHTFVEIGAMLKVPASKVRTFKARALKRLRELCA